MMPNYQNQFMNNPYNNNYYGQQNQNYYQPQMPQTIVGKMVENFNSVTANDVPMNGQPATFIKNDLSEIQLRMWNANGQIQTAIFKPMETSPKEETKAENDAFKSLTEVFESNFAAINDRFDKLEKAIMPKPTTRKKVDADE